MTVTSRGGRLLDGSVALVTGAGRGIGRGIARELAAAGANLVLLGRTRRFLEETAEEVRALGVTAFPAVADLLDLESVERAVDEGHREFPTIDILVNNAGALVFAKCWEYDEETYRTMVDTNLTGGFFLCQMFGRRWLHNSTAGRIVNVASVESEVAYPDQAPYAASKGGILTMTKVLAREWGERGIRVNAVGPGPIDTPISQKFRELSEAGIVFNRLGEPDEVGRAVVFLVSDMASFITGTILYVDGGYMLS